MSFPVLQGGNVVLRDGKVGFGQECCCPDDPPPPAECEGCFLNFAGVFNWQFTGTCNGNPVNLNGVLVDGVDPDVFMSMSCTTDAICQGGPQQEGLFFSFFDGACAFRGFVAGGTLTHPCDTARTVVGTYVLTSCTGNGNGTLVIT